MTRVAMVQASRSSSIYSRTLEFSRMLGSLGHELSIYGVSTNPEAVATNFDIADPPVPAKLYPADDDTQPAVSTRSKALIDAIVADRPDVVIIIGLGFDIGNTVIAATRSFAKFGAIFTGKWWHKSSRIMDYVFVEHENQIRDLKERLEREAWYIHMPKLIPWGRVDAVRGVQRDIDICNVSRFDKHKNQIALAGLFDKASITFAGRGRSVADVQAAAAGHDRVSFLGKIPHDEVFHLMSRSRLMVHPSLWEGVPRSCIEAFACGTPVVALRSTLGRAFDGLPFVVLVEEHEIEATVMGLLGDPERLERMSRLAAEYAREKNGPDSLRRVVEAFDRQLRLS